MNPQGVSEFIKNSHVLFTRKEVLKCWMFPLLGILADAALFWHGIPSTSYEDSGINYSTFQTHFLYIFFFALVMWGIWLLIKSNETVKFVRTREFYMGSSLLLSAIAFLTVGLKLLFMFGETQDIIWGIIMAVVSLTGSIVLGITIINGRIYKLSDPRKKKKQKMMSATLGAILIPSSVILSISFARVYFSSVTVPDATDEPLIALAIFTALSFIFSWLAAMSYYQIYLQYKFKLMDMKA